MLLPSLDVLHSRTKVYPLFHTKFSAKLRLDKNSPVYSTPDGLDKHVEQIIETLGKSCVVLGIDFKIVLYI